MSYETSSFEVRLNEKFPFPPLNLPDTCCEYKIKMSAYKLFCYKTQLNGYLYRYNKKLSVVIFKKVDSSYWYYEVLVQEGIKIINITKKLKYLLEEWILKIETQNPSFFICLSSDYDIMINDTLIKNYTLRELLPYISYPDTLKYYARDPIGFSSYYEDGRLFVKIDDDHNFLDISKKLVDIILTKCSNYYNKGYIILDDEQDSSFIQNWELKKIETTGRLSLYISDWFIPSLVEDMTLFLSERRSQKKYSFIFRDSTKMRHLLSKNISLSNEIYPGAIRLMLNNKNEAEIFISNVNKAMSQRFDYKVVSSINFKYIEDVETVSYEGPFINKTKSYAKLYR